MRDLSYSALIAVCGLVGALIVILYHIAIDFVCARFSC